VDPVDPDSDPDMEHWWVGRYLESLAWTLAKQMTAIASRMISSHEEGEIKS
jgi:hypothetical protein